METISDKMAFLISAYTEPESLYTLIRKLDGMLCADFYIHIDKKVNIELFRFDLEAMPNVFFVKKRVRVYWGGYSQVEMQLSMIEEMLNRKKHYTRVINLTGTDYPVVDGKTLYERLNDKKVEYICGFDVKRELFSGKRKTGKQELMNENRVASGMMFKLDFDPRIIGNEVLPDGTKKTGIGEFIRRTSIDELPQGFNVLLNQMSLVGTRPPTVDEWEKYELHHRARLATKPGITGMWQVSGRSEITDFEEITRLDTEYIENWSIGLDIRILLKTIGAVLGHRGAM